MRVHSDSVVTTLNNLQDSLAALEEAYYGTANHSTRLGMFGRLNLFSTKKSTPITELAVINRINPLLFEMTHNGKSKDMRTETVGFDVFDLANNYPGEPMFGKWDAPTERHKTQVMTVSVREDTDGSHIFIIRTNKSSKEFPRKSLSAMQTYVQKNLQVFQ